MVREIVKTECHIRFDESALEVWNIPITTIDRTPIVREESDSTIRDDEPRMGKAASDKYHVVLEREADASTSTSTTWGKSAPTSSLSPHTESSLDAEDAVQKMGDALRDNVFWWVIEIIPTYCEWQNEQREWAGKWR
jgi:hypothetical protein